MPVLSSAGFSSTAAAAAARRSSGANRSTPPSFDSAGGAAAAANPLRRPSALILRFPPNFVRQLSTKARRNCSNIGVAQIVAASWSDSPDSPATSNLPAAAAAEEVATAAGVSGTPVPSPVAVLAAAEDAVAVLTTVEEFATAAGVNGSPLPPPVTVPADAAADGVNGVVVPEAAEDGSTDGVNGVAVPAAEEDVEPPITVDSLLSSDGSTDGVNGVAVPAVEEDVEPPITVDSLLSSDGSLAVHAGERSGRGIVTDAITTPIVNTSAYWFKNSQELIDFKEKRHTSFEYGRYGNPTTEVLEKKMSALERAESTLFVSSGMYASVAMMTALVPPGGHIITTTDCYRKTRIFVQNELSKSGISAIVIDPADMDSLRRALDENNVSLFFTESPTNPFLRCVDIDLVSQLCHSKGALVCIDGTFASPVNQKALTFGADIVLHSATKFIAGHNDVLGGCLSGSEELISRVRQYHHVIGGVINPNASSMIIRGMKTLHLRVQHQNSTALRMAQFLEEHPKITRVYYPGLTSHPEHHIAKRQMTGFGGVVSFEIAGDLKATSKFIDSLKIPYLAPSFGGCESIVDQPAIMSYWDLEAPERAKYGIMDNLVRFSFGIEGFEDLKADIVQALAKI